MKRHSFRIVSFILILIMISSLASDNPSITGFTHPEIGEFVVYYVDNDMPYFTIYGFTQYKVINPDAPYRGIQVNTKNKALSFDNVLNKYFDNIADKNAENPPIIFEYTGLLGEYEDRLQVLSKKDKIEAIKLLSGFEGIVALPKLKKIDGFQDIDINYLEENYSDFVVEINGKTYPYRILMFYIEEEDWQESYYERYCFIKQGNSWNLSNIFKEYASDYRQRNKYIHGLAGNTPEMYESIDHDALRGNNWFSSIENIASSENITNYEGSIYIKDTQLYRLPADLTYIYEGEWLSRIEYKLLMQQSYYSAYVSLYMRYYDPVTILPNGNMTWFLPDMTIELVFDNDNPLIIYTPIVDFESISEG